MKKPMKPMKPAKDAVPAGKPMPFWMKSKMGMKKKPSDNDGDE